MKNNEIRRLFLDYFVKNGHLEFPSASVVPDNDPTLMFTSAGMVQFKDIFTGAVPKPTPPRIVTSQKCLRAGGKHNDLENVGYTTRHHTFFEMLGNFSFGDYFKEHAIELAWNLITQEFGLPKEKLLVTVYHDDDEAATHWRKIAGLNDERILRIATSDNFWQMGDTGPCGPCSEIFFDHGEKLPGGPPGTPEEDGPRFTEIWNLVFMQFEQQEGGVRSSLPKPSIDTGMGLERIGAVLQGTHDNYDTDSLRILAEAVGNQLNTDPYGTQSASHKVIVDHLRACSFMIADGVMPSNEGRGYVLRRILRRALRHAHLLGAREPILHKLLPSLVREMGGHFNELVRAEASIAETLRLESTRFLDMLDRGLKLLDAEAGDMGKGDTLDGGVAFKLYDTFGFPVDLTADILRSRGASVDMHGFDAAMGEQKARARAAWVGTGDQGQDTLWQAIPSEIPETDFLGYSLLECSAEIQAIIVDGQAVESVEAPASAMIITNQTPFYAESGGQQGDQGTLEAHNSTFQVLDTQKQRGIFVHQVKLETGRLNQKDVVKLSVDSDRRRNLHIHHTATHLLHRALQIVLGNHVAQKGSLVSPTSLRFDFSHSAALAEQEKWQVEQMVNTEIRANTAINTKIMTPDDAIKEGAMALFGEKYGDEVRVVSMGQQQDGKSFSLELCGGTHAHRTGDIGLLMLRSERGIAAGVRRIEAVCGESALANAREQQQRMQNIADHLKVAPAEIEKRLEGLTAERAALRKQLEAAQQQSGSIDSERIGDTILYCEHRAETSAKNLKPLADQWRDKHKNGVYVVIATEGEKSSVVVASQEADIDAVALVRIASEMLGGKGGGGRSDLAQAGGNKTDDLCIQSTFHAIKQHLSS